MSLCECPERPRCEYHHCGDPADWSFFTPPVRRFWGPHGYVMFMCTPCKEYYADSISKPLKGIDRPEGADEDWRPSLMDHLRHAQIDMAFAERNKSATALEPPPQDYLDRYWLWYEKHREFTPAQILMRRTHRALVRKYASSVAGSGKVT